MKRDQSTGTYSIAEIQMLKERMIVCLVSFGMSQKATAEMLGVAPKTICKWVGEAGGWEAIKKQFADRNRLFKDSANGLLMYAKKSKEFAHVYPDMEAAYRKFTSVI